MGTSSARPIWPGQPSKAQLEPYFHLPPPLLPPPRRNRFPALLLHCYCCCHCVHVHLLHCTRPEGVALPRGDSGDVARACGLVLLEAPAVPLLDVDIGPPEVRSAIRSLGGHGRLHASRAIDVVAVGPPLDVPASELSEEWQVARSVDFVTRTPFKMVPARVMNAFFDIGEADGHRGKHDMDGACLLLSI
eukprot:6099842-Pyramimonas_sp.AAC.1